MSTQADAALDPIGEMWHGPGRRINYTLTGDGSRGIVLLISGLGMQRIEWPREFIAAIQRAGYRTLLADNRDCGGTDVSSDGAYSLADMAGDLIALLDGLAIERVHVVGMSMGGMLAQHVALQAQERCLSLTSIMSTTGRRGVGRPHEQAKWIFTTPSPAAPQEAFVDYAVRSHRSIAGERYVDEPHARAVAERVFARGPRPDGTARQLAAIQADGDRSERLATLTLPTLVVHGDADSMIDVSGGEDTAAAVPGARLVIVPELGHSVPRELSAELAAMLVEHFAEASA